MAKRKGDKPKSDRRPKGSAPSIQQLDDDARAVLFDQHKDAYTITLAAKKAADAKFKNACKLAKAELGKHAVAQIKLAVEMDTPEGEAAVRERLASMAEVARWVGADLGTQFEMFDGGDKSSTDRAREAGKRAGRAGEPAKPPHAPETDAYAAWMEGHADGNAALATAGFKPLDEPKGSMPRKEWAKNLRANNEDAERHIKETSRSIGDAAPSARIEGGKQPPAQH